MRLKVCILAHENVQHWTPFYLEAFRQRCDVRVIGGPIAPFRLPGGNWEQAPPPARPNDIVDESPDAPTLLARLPEDWDPDLVVAIQSGRPDFVNIAAIRRPTAYISVDTWHDWHELAVPRAVDFVFAAQRVFPDYLRDGGAPRAYWLPLACDPQCHRPMPANLLYDIVFVGTTKYIVNEQRVARLLRLAQNFRVARQEDIGPDDMCRVYCSGKLVFNSSVSQDLNMRVFEAMATGRPLLTNRNAAINGLDTLFEEHRHYIGYDDDDLIEQVKRYLADDALRETIGQTARQCVLDQHTYLHRVDTLLETLSAKIPGLGALQGPLLRQGDALSAYLPFGGGTLLDIGLGLDRSRHALRPLGIHRCVGAGKDAAELARRRGSYDETLAWPIAPASHEPFDVVLWTAPLAFMATLEEALTFGRALLRTGGTLVLKLDPASANAATPVVSGEKNWDVWLYEQGFHLLLLNPPANGSQHAMLMMRAYARTVHDMHTEIHERWTGGQKTTTIL